MMHGQQGLIYYFNIEFAFFIELCCTLFKGQDWHVHVVTVLP